MDTSSIITVIVLCLLIVMSAFFSATETAFSSMNRIRMKNLAEKGNKRAKQVLRISEDYSKFLSTVLVGNNIVNIAGTSIATVLFMRFWGDMGATLSTIVMTVVVLIFGEISPKTLAQESPERFAQFAAPVIRVFMVVLTPVNFLFSAWKKLLARLFKAGGGSSITEEELLTMVDEAEQEGAIDSEDKTLIRNAIEFNDCSVEDIITPRVEIEGVPADADMESVADIFIKTGYMRLPVYEGNLDKITGMIHLHDFFELNHKGGQAIDTIIAPVLFTAPFTKISALLKTLQDAKVHMAVVVDEHGGTMGIATMEDILEELVGEIWDEHDEVVTSIQQLDAHTYRVMGQAEVSHLARMLGIPLQSGATTVNGWITEQLGRFPQRGDSFVQDGLQVQVTKAARNRVEESVVTLRADAAAEED